MSPFILFLGFIVIVVGVFCYMTYRTNAQRRAREKRRNQYNDRV